jgi:CAAX protease family protein
MIADTGPCVKGQKALRWRDDEPYGETVNADIDPSRVSTRALTAFVIGAFAWSWSCWFVAPHIANPFADVLAVAGRFGPSLAALAVVAASHGTGLRRFLADRVHVRVSLGDGFVAVLGPVIVVLAALGLAAAGGEELGEFNDPSTLYLVVPAFVVVLMIGGPLGEEIGWRGFALDPLQERFGAVGASVLLGMVWALWHLPLFFDDSQVQHDLSPLLFLGQILATSIVYTWLWNRSRSLPAVMVLHTAANLSAGVFPLLVPDADSHLPFAIAVALASIIAVALVVATRGRLGRRPGVEGPGA